MKKLSGIKKSFSSLENKKLTDLTMVQGGRRPSIGASDVRSNFLNAQGQQDIDAYDQYGNWSFRYWDNLSPGC
ncbi:TIGR04139 family peptide modification target [Pedobacter petrophilus]|uniref:TIGR04139 family peptide modification target n=1 Tax=Pedobacter petrophilus TaxID=1908241 RepID=A0A7K0G3I0_9SPHI|nr:TIGR04139 family peptide modification target [Pedobacter petrophilus]MRX78368.1 TIGR04139 family peptide modification target [Pedobacter petrophilus]